MVVRVSKRRWLRGDVENSALLHGTKMCCLGFAARDLGQTAEEIRGKGLPDEIDQERLTDAMCASPFVCAKDIEGAPYYIASKFSEKAASINDSIKLTDTERMKRLRALFKENGHRIVFVP